MIVRVLPLLTGPLQAREIVRRVKTTLGYTTNDSTGTDISGLQKRDYVDRSQVTNEELSDKSDKPRKARRSSSEHRNVAASLQETHPKTLVSPEMQTGTGGDFYVEVD